MTAQVTPTQETYEPKQPAEAGFSCNMFLTNDVMGRIQFTFRGATSADWGHVLEDVDRFAHYMREKGWKFDGEARVPRQSAPVSEVPNSEDVAYIPVVGTECLVCGETTQSGHAHQLATKEPTRVSIDDSGKEQPQVKVATAGRLSIETKDGKYYYKVADAIFAQGERGTKFGISVYPEVLRAANLDVREGQPVPNINGWRVDYVLNEKGYPWKVTRLLPPK